MGWRKRERQITYSSGADQYARDALADLVAIDTTSSLSDHSVAKASLAGSQYVASYLQDHAGASIVWGDASEEPAGSGKFHRPMLAVWYPPAGKQDPAAEPLIFSAHIDTVPAEKETWPGGQPHKLHEAGDRLVGRGTIDMKGAVAAMMAQMRERFEKGDLASLNRPVMFALSYGEETALKGAAPICDLLKGQGVRSGEFVILEGSDGHVLTGTKGGIQDKIEFTAHPSVPPTEQYPHYLDITIESPGGHSSNKGGAPTDPARAATLVLSYVEAMREQGIPAELCQMDYGIAPNRVGGALRLTLGYKAPGHLSADWGDVSRIQEIPRELERWLSGKASDVNRPGLLKIIRKALHFDTGKLKITVSQPGTLSDAELNEWSQQKELGTYVSAHAASHPSFPITLSSENGKYTCHNAVERLLSTLHKMYEIHDRQHQHGAPSGFLLEPVVGMGRTKVSGTMVRSAGQEQATLYYDIRYPLEASRFAGETKTPAKPIENAYALNDEIIAHAKADPRVSAIPTRVSHFEPSRVTPKDDPRIGQYQAISKQAKLNAQGRSLVSIASYGSDGNVISRHFPGAFVINYGAGTYQNRPHGEGEFITKQQLAANTQAVGLILEQRAGARPNIQAAARI